MRRAPLAIDFLESGLLIRHGMAIQPERPRLLVVDDDRAVLALVGTGVTCLDVLHALRTMRPNCEAVLMTGYTSLNAAVDALKHTIQEPGSAGWEAPSSAEAARPASPVSLVDVEREHIVRTLEQVHGNKAVAARLLGVSRRAFYRQLERHGLHQRIPMARRSSASVGVGARA